MLLCIRILGAGGIVGNRASKRERERAAADSIDQMRRGTTTLAILKLLVDADEPLHGYRMIQELEKRSRGIFQFNEGLIYPRLHQMEHDGLLGSHWEGEPGTRRRKVYVVTEKGHRRLETEMEQWRTFRHGMRLLLGLEQAPA
jgi:DNA-binding PadR family transcriptional regulator